MKAKTHHKPDFIRTFPYSGQEIRRDSENSPYIFAVNGVICTTIYLTRYHKPGDKIKARLIKQYASDTGFFEFNDWLEV